MQQHLRNRQLDSKFPAFYIVWNPKLVRNSPPLVHVLSQRSSVHTLPFCWKIHSNIVLRRSKGTWIKNSHTHPHLEPKLRVNGTNPLPPTPPKCVHGVYSYVTFTNTSILTALSLLQKMSKLESFTITSYFCKTRFDDVVTSRKGK
jgi:hypothetical protein